jgi:hypothetical protein
MYKTNQNKVLLILKNTNKFCFMSLEQNIQKVLWSWPILRYYSSMEVQYCEKPKEPQYSPVSNLNVNHTNIHLSFPMALQFLEYPGHLFMIHFKTIFDSWHDSQDE